MPRLSQSDRNLDSAFLAAGSHSIPSSILRWTTLGALALFLSACGSANNHTQKGNSANDLQSTKEQEIQDRISQVRNQISAQSAGARDFVNSNLDSQRARQRAFTNDQNETQKEAEKNPFGKASLPSGGSGFAQAAAAVFGILGLKAVTNQLGGKDKKKEDEKKDDKEKTDEAATPAAEGEKPAEEKANLLTTPPAPSPDPASTDSEAALAGNSAGKKENAAKEETLETILCKYLPQDQQTDAKTEIQASLKKIFGHADKNSKPDMKTETPK